VSSVLSSIEGGAVGGATAIAVGAGLEPTIEPGKQEVWANNAYRVLEANILARLVAQGLVGFDPAAEQAKRTGFDANKFRGLVELAKAGPPVAEALNLRRRDRITAEQFEHALSKAQIEPQYWPALKELVDERLDPAVIALAIVRGIMKDPGFLPVGPPSAVGKVPAFPTSPLDTTAEAASSGVNLERLFVETAIAGRPMGPEAAASAVFRDILERVDFDRAIAEGDVRNEWANAIFQTARQIPSVADYVNARIRGWISEAEMNAGTARHGMSAEDTHLLYLRTGRPAAPGQMATAAARGIDGPDGVPMNREQFLKGIAESDIRPEWGPMLWESRFLYPPLFQLTRLVQGGAIDADTAAEWARKDRYPPEVVTALHSYWTQTGTSGADPHVARAETQLWSALHRSFVARETNVTQARANMTTLGIPRDDQTTILNLWQAERDLIRRQLTPAQIKKAYRKASQNAATGAPWTRDEAVAALVSEGYSVQTANDYLDIP
jgi:hypothetical protein